MEAMADTSGAIHLAPPRCRLGMAASRSSHPRREFKFRRLLASATKHMRTRLQAATLTDAQRRQVEKYIAELELMSVTREYAKVKELELSMQQLVPCARKKATELPPETT